MTSKASTRKRECCSNDCYPHERRWLIPEVRERLHEIAEETGNAELNFLANQLIRRFHGRGPNVSNPVTPELAAQVRILHQENPKMAYHQIGERLGVSQGRVSEIIHGKRS